ncbi:MAG: hypothetical protein HC913_09380 [Microscillaceae bacterium]|nr:hypothetical protein [Microscillaceae bacterium]
MFLSSYILLYSFYWGILLGPFQEVSAWKTLAEVQIKRLVQNGYEIETPIFSANLKKLNGHWISLRGYILPLDLDPQKSFVFSRYPYNACYFCGAAGPETVLEVVPRQPIPYQEKPITLRGRLYLNSDNPDKLMYL